MHLCRISGRYRLALVAIAALLLSADGAAAQDQALALPNSERLLSDLLNLFVAATVLESALTTLFQWRLYREFFNGRAVKTIVMAATGLMVVQGFDFDIFARIMRDAGGNGEVGPLSAALSALILAGGSAAVYELLTKLGFRSPVAKLDDQPKPAETQAWISVKIVPQKAIGPIQIHIEKVAVPTADDDSLPALAGIVGGRPFLARLANLFFADAMRYPSYGGRTLDANAVYKIVATSFAKGDGDEPTKPFEKQIFRGRFAGRAVVDFVEFM